MAGAADILRTLKKLEEDTAFLAYVLEHSLRTVHKSDCCSVL